MRKTFRARQWLAALLSLALVVSLAPAAAAANPTISVSPSGTITLEQGGTETLTATVTTDPGETAAVTWTSNDNGIATVSGSGTSATVRGVKTGTATITATATVTTTDTTGTTTTKTGTATVTVGVLPRVTLSSPSQSLDIGKSVDLEALVDGKKETTGITWNSDDTSVATVDTSGKVTAVGGGTARITATYTSGATTVVSSPCTVTVKPLEITLEPSSFTLTAGVAQTVKATTNYARDALAGSWKFKSSTGIIIKELEHDGRQCVFEVKANQETLLDQWLTVQYGYTISADTYTAEKYIDLGVKYPEIAFSPEKLTLTVGSAEKVKASLVGIAMDNASWTWKLEKGNTVIDLTKDINDSSVATITAKTDGTALISATYTSDSKPVKTATYEVEVERFTPPTVTLTPTPGGETLTEGQKLTLKAAASPAMTGEWSWNVKQEGGTSGDSVSSNDTTANTNKSDTLEVTANEYNKDNKNDVTVTATFTLTDSALDGAIAAGEDKDNNNIVTYTATYRFLVKEADYALELDKTSLSFDLLKPNPQFVTATLTKGGKGQDGKTIIFDAEVKDADGNKIAEVKTSANDSKTDSSGKIPLTVTPKGVGTGDLKVKYNLTSTGNFTPSVEKVCKITVTGPSLRINPTTLDLDTIDKPTAVLTATIEGGGTVNLANIQWVTSKVTDGKGPIVEISYDKTGHCKVTALRNGTTRVRATYTLNGEVSGDISAVCTVNVGAYSLTISPEEDVLKEPGETENVTATVKKIGKNDVTVPNHEQYLSWQISDGTIARFDNASGPLQKSGARQVKVVGIPGKTGTVQVTVRWKYKNEQPLEKTLSITFAAPEAESFSFTLPRSTVSGKTGGDLTQTPTTGAIKWNTGKTYPVPGDFKPTYTYQSSDTKVAKVEQGKVVGVGAGEATITVSGSATANGKAITAEPKTYKVVVSADLSVKSIKLSATSLSLDVGGRQTVTATTDPAGAVVVWSSSDEKVATVNAGTIVAVGPGSATITAAAGGQTAQVQVTVNGLEQLLDEITVTEGKTVSVDTIFKAHGTAAGKNPTYSSLDPTVASYANGSIVGNKVGNTSITIASGSYRISVKVTVVADSTSIIDLPTLYTQSQPVLRFRDFIARFRPQAGGNLSHIVGLNLDTAKGTLYYNYTSANEPGAGVGADSYYLSPAAGQRGIEDITFVPKAGYSGRVTINYTAVSTGGQNFVCSIVFDVDPGTGTGSGLNLSTPYNTPLRFSGAEFNRVCQDRLGVRLDYVTFSQPSGQQGTLYTNYVSAGNYGKVVSGNDQYTTKALDDVWFVPAPGFSGSVTVYYTAYGVGGASYSGQASIAVGWENNVAIGGLTYDINRGGVAYFDDFRFSSYCRQVLDSSKNLSHIRFSSLPASNEGVLYYNYNSSSRTQASTGTNYYYNSSSPYIDRLAFAAASGFTGTVKIPFTGWTTDGVSFTGNVEVNVQSGGGSGSAGDIIYICGAGQTVSFDDRDFNDLSRNRTGSSLNYITLESLPGSSSGSVYYNSSRASTGTNYRNGSSTPRIDNLSFRASNSFYGAVDIPFTGRATNGETFRGVITVASSSSLVNSGSGSNASQTVFTDMAGYSAAQQAAVNYLYDHNITRGMTTTQYGPQNSIRRGDFARMVYIAFDLTPSASSRPFQDVPATAYYAQAVNALYSRGIVSGIGGGLYDPNGTLTRQDAVCIVQRAMRAVGWSADDGSVSSLYRYSDGGSVSGYAQGAMAFAVDRGILPTGGSWLNPTQPLSRVDMAEILYRVLANSGY